jgi:hypothetical protein
VARAIGRDKLARRWHRESLTVRRILRRDFWNPATECFNFGKLADGSYRTERTILTTLGIYFQVARKEQAAQSLSAYSSTNFSADWGVRIVGTDNPLFNPAGYHYGSVWPLFTGWASLAEFAGGRPAEGFQHLSSNVGLFRHFAAGFTEEVLHGARFEPAGVCPHQAWSETMILQPIVEGMLGLRPDALSRTVALRPYLPPHWATVEVTNIRIGRKLVHLNIRREKGLTRFQFRSSTRRPINVMLQPFLPLGTTVAQVRVGSRISNRKKLVREYSDVPVVEFKLQESIDIAFVHSAGVAVLPPQPIMTRGQESSAMRIVQERWEERAYHLTVEGKVGSRYSLLVFDPDHTIRAAEGAEIRERSGERLELLVPIDQEGSRSYGRKEVKLLLR